MAAVEKKVEGPLMSKQMRSYLEHQYGRSLYLSGGERKPGCSSIWSYIPDLRSRKRIERELVANGYIEVASDGGFLATSKAWDEIDVGSEPLDMVAMWTAAKDGGHHWAAWATPMMPNDEYSELDNNHLMKRLWLSRDQLRWFAVNAECANRYRHQEPREVDCVEAVIPKGATPAQFAAALVEAEDKAETQLRSAGSKFPSVVLMVTTDQMIQHVKDHREQREFRRVFAANFAWGLQATGILTAEEAELVNERKATPMLFLPAPVGSGSEPVNWGTLLAEGIAEAGVDILRLAKRLAAMEKAQRGIIAMGGIGAFLAQYESLLRAKLAEKDLENKS